MGDMTIETEKYKGLTIRIEYDQHSKSPRDWDNLGTFIGFHRRYNIGDTRGSDFSTPEDVQEYLAENPSIILSVYMYEHSGVAYSTTPFSCPWDSGQVGVIFVEKVKAAEEYGALTDEVIEKIKSRLKGEIETYSKWANGEVYGFIVEDKDGEHVDSCWGFYETEEALEEAKMNADHHVDDVAVKLESEGHEAANELLV
jgi:hypothetical protein